MRYPLASCSQCVLVGRNTHSGFTCVSVRPGPRFNHVQAVVPLECGVAAHADTAVGPEPATGTAIPIVLASCGDSKNTPESWLVGVHATPVDVKTAIESSGHTGMFEGVVCGCCLNAARDFRDLLAMPKLAAAEGEEQGSGLLAETATKTRIAITKQRVTAPSAMVIFSEFIFLLSLFYTTGVFNFLAPCHAKMRDFYRLGNVFFRRGLHKHDLFRRKCGSF